MLKDGMNPMSVEFLYELFAAALRSETICGVVVARHVKKEYLPDRAFQKILLALSNTTGIIRNRLHTPYSASFLILTMTRWSW